MTGLKLYFIDAFNLLCSTFAKESFLLVMKTKANIYAVIGHEIIQKYFHK